MSVVGRWYITQHALECYMRIRRTPETDEGFEAAEDEMLLLMSSAKYRQTDSQGRQLWRSPTRTGYGLRWLVSFALRKEGELPQVIWVGQGRPPEKMWRP